MLDTVFKGFSRTCVMASAAVLTAFFAEAQTFSVRPRLLPVGPNPSAIIAHDLNGNGLPDIITADRGVMSDPRDERPANDELSLLMAQGDLNYIKLHPSLKTDFAPYAIAVANIDAIKWPDIIVASFLAARHRDISLFLNKPQENLFEPFFFRAPDDHLPYFRQRDGDGAEIFTRPGLTSLVVKDINGDGLRDVITTGWSSDVLVIFPGHAEDHFDAPRFVRAPGGPRDLSLADFDKDGNTDLAVAMYANAEIALFKGDGQGSFEETGRFNTRGRLPNRVRVADINRDGIADIIVSHCYSDDSIVIFYGDGKFQFSVSQEIMLGTDREILEHEIRDMVVEDLSGDGRPDIAVACFASGKIVVLVNESNDSVLPQRFRRENYAFDQGRPRALCAADFTQNGKKDLAVALWDVDSVGFLLNQK